MKKAFLLVMTIGFVLAMSGLAFASAGPHSGPNFAQTTDACAGCHRGHTAVLSSLLKQGTTYYSFCTSCHDGTGANTNVVDGVFLGTVTSWSTQTYGTAGAGLNGGGFSNAKPYTARSSRTGTSAAVTSKHDVTSDTATYTAWGGGSTGPGTTMTLTCVTCHDAHGNTNYRILKSTVNSVTGLTVTSNESTIDYTKDQYKSGQSTWCVACHTQYKTTQGIVGNSSGTYDAGDSQGAVVRYRHPMDVALGATNASNLNTNTPLPVDQTTYSAAIGASDTIQCLTCHQAHGTSSTMTSNATVAPASDSALLRLNNRGVCQYCHQK